MAKVGWAGYAGVELSLPGPLPLPEEELAQRLRANSLEVIAIHAGVIPAGGRGAEEELSRIGRTCLLARALDAATVIVEAPAEGEVAALAHTLGLLRGALGETAVDLCLANKTGTLLSRPASFTELRAAGLEAPIGLALDPGQALLAGWDLADLAGISGRIRHVYLTDADPALGRSVPAGDGNADFEKLAAHLEEAGYVGAISLLLQNADPWDVEPRAQELRDQAAEWFRIAP